MSIQKDQDRTLKRQWLRCRGLMPARLAASTSQQPADSAPSLQADDIQGTLCKIRDDAWVLKACLSELDRAVEDDSISTSPQGLGALQSLLEEGIRRTGTAASAAKREQPLSPATLAQLATRKTLLHLRRRLQVWTSAAPTQGQAADEPSDEWGLDTAVEQPSDPGLPRLSLLLQPALEDVAGALIASQQLGDLRKLLNDPHLSHELLLHRQALVQLLLESLDTPEQAREAIALRLLPFPSDGSGAETSAWSDGGQPPPEDVTDEEPIRSALQSHGLQSTDEQGGSRRLQSAKELLAWYAQTLRDLERQGSDPRVIATICHWLAQAAVEGQVQEVASLARDLDILSTLSTACTSSDAITLDTVQLLSTSEDEAAVSELLASMLRAAKGKGVARTYADAVLPTLHSLAGRKLSDSKRQAQYVQERCLALAFRLSDDAEQANDDGAFSTLCEVLQTESQLAAQLGPETMQALTLATVASSTRTDLRSVRAMEAVLAAVQRRSASSSSSANRPAALGALLRPLQAPQREHAGREDQAPASAVYAAARASGRSMSEALSEAHGVLLVMEALAPWKVAAPLAWYAVSDAATKRRLLRKIVQSGGAASRSEEEWRSLLAALLSDNGRLAWHPLSAKEVYELVLTGILMADRVALFKSLISSTAATALDGLSLPTLSHDEQEAVVIRASQAMYERSASMNHHKGDMKTAHDVLSALPSSAALKRQRDFIEATSRLGSYRLRSALHGGDLPLTAAEISSLSAAGRQALLASVLVGGGGGGGGASGGGGEGGSGAGGEAYKAWEALLDVGVKLGLAARDAPPKPLLEARTLAMLTDAAVANQDLRRAAAIAKKLLAVVEQLRRRAAAAARSSGGGGGGSQSNAASASTPSAAAQLPEAEELAWKACYQLAKQDTWADDAARLAFMGHVLALAPNDQLGPLARRWDRLREQVSREPEHDGSAEEAHGQEQARDDGHEHEHEQGARPAARRRPGLSAPPDLFLACATANRAGGSGGAGGAGRVLSLGLGSHLSTGAHALSAAGAGVSASLGSLMDAYASPFAGLLAHAGTSAASAGGGGGARAALAGAGGAQPQQQQPHEQQAPPRVSRLGALGGGGFGGRAASLLDALSAGTSGSGGGAAHDGSGPLPFSLADPAARAASAASAARSFLGGFAGRVAGAGAGAGAWAGSDQQQQHREQEQGAHAFSFSKGVGWLLGEGEGQGEQRR